MKTLSERLAEYPLLKQIEDIKNHSEVEWTQEEIDESRKFFKEVIEPLGLAMLQRAYEEDL